MGQATTLLQDFHTLNLTILECKYDIISLDELKEKTLNLTILECKLKRPY